MPASFAGKQPFGRLSDLLRSSFEAFSPGLPPLPVGENRFRRAGGADLSGVQRRTSRPVDAEGPRRFAHGVKAPDPGPPFRVHGDPAVVVLGSQGDLQRFVPEIDPVRFVEGRSTRIHGGEPFERCSFHGAGSYEVLPRRLLA